MAYIELSKINEREQKGKKSMSDKYQPDFFYAEKKSISKYPFFLYVVGIIYLYPLFALQRIKMLFAFNVGGKETTNEIWIIPLLCLVIYLSKKVKLSDKMNKTSLVFLMYIFVYIFIIAIGGFHTSSFIQFIYACLLFIVPIFLIFPMLGCKSEQIIALFKFFVLVCLVYATFAIVLSTNYAYFNSLLGNSVDNYRYYSQYRASMMIGSSITVSYYFNITLPLCFYMYFTSNQVRWRIISAITIIVVIIATFVLLSRLAAICTLLIIGYSLFFTKGSKKNSWRKIGFILLILVASVYAYENYDLNRILSGFSFSGDMVNSDRSEDLRAEASDLGLHIFTKYPIFGSGMARFYERVYSNRFITVDGITGLIDPHNMYVLILSELGLVGLIITILLFGTFLKRFSRIKEKNLRHTANITLLAFLFDAMGGSQLFNEISFATIFWIYMGLFNALTKEEGNYVESADKVLK